MSRRLLIHDWNLQGGQPRQLAAVDVEDHTLAEGVKAPGLRAPSAKEAFLEATAAVGTVTVCLAPEDACRLAPRVKALGMQVSCRAASAEETQSLADAGVAPSLHVSADDGHADIKPLPNLTVVIDDAARAHPAPLRRVIEAAVAAGAHRVCLFDDTGHASPRGAARVVRFALRVLDDCGAPLHVDWRGSNAYDLAVMNALSAVEAGARRIHGTAMGLGPGAGSTPLDLVLVNLRLLGWIDRDLTALQKYCDTVAEVLGCPIPVNYPVFGLDAFRTATGVHAAAIIKARNKGDEWLADRVYSGVPAGWFGRHQVIEVGPMSGESNVVAWLAAHQHENRPGLAKRILARAKAGDHILSREEIEDEIRLVDA